MTTVYSVSSSYDYGEAYSFHGVFSSAEKVDAFIRQEVEDAAPIKATIHGSVSDGYYNVATIGANYYYVEVCTLDVPFK